MRLKLVGSRYCNKRDAKDTAFHQSLAYGYVVRVQNVGEQYKVEWFSLETE